MKLLCKTRKHKYTFIYCAFQVIFSCDLKTSHPLILMLEFEPSFVIKGSAKEFDFLSSFKDCFTHSNDMLVQQIEQFEDNMLDSLNFSNIISHDPLFHNKRALCLNKKYLNFVIITCTNIAL